MVARLVVHSIAIQIRCLLAFLSTSLQFGLVAKPLNEPRAGARRLEVEDGLTSHRSGRGLAVMVGETTLPVVGGGSALPLGVECRLHLKKIAEHQ